MKNPELANNSDQSNDLADKWTAMADSLTREKSTYKEPQIQRTFQDAGIAPPEPEFTPEPVAWSPEKTRLLNDYEESFISDFSEWEYENFLNPLGESDIKNMNEIAGSYLGTKNADARELAFKESLDHYVLKRISSDQSFLKSSAFKNYKKFIGKIAASKISYIDGIPYYPEYSTNPVLSNPVLQTALFAKNTENARNHQARNERVVGSIVTKMQKERPCSTSELDFLGDYISKKKNVPETAKSELINYVYNQPAGQVRLEASEGLLSGLLTCFADNFSLDNRVKKTRMFVASIDHEKHIDNAYAHARQEVNYCVFNKDYVIDADLMSDEAINNFASGNNDRYLLMSVAFHELAHRCQFFKANDPEVTNSGLGAILDILIRREHRRLQDSDKYGGDSSNIFYDDNHDSFETEIEADEIGWAESAKFIGQNFLKSKTSHKNRVNFQDKLLKCYKNQNFVKTRRAFARIFDPETNTERRYDEYDISKLTEIVTREPYLIYRYPMLSEYFTEAGALREGLLYKNITINNINTKETNEVGMMFIRHIINTKPDSLLTSLCFDDLNESDFLNCINNISDVIRRNSIDLKNVASAPRGTFDGTYVHFDFETEKHALPKFYSNLCSKQVKFAKEAYKILKIRFPSSKHWDLANALMEQNQKSLNDCLAINRKGL